jgi:CRISPR-associated endonuclease Csn1
MSQDVLSEFDKGNSVSQTAERTRLRGVRRLHERHILRRERLHRVLHILGFLPEHYDESIDFVKNLGQYKENTEPKLVYRTNLETLHTEFLFQQWRIQAANATLVSPNL